jgi:antiviral helicase SLH1
MDDYVRMMSNKQMIESNIN